MTKKQAKKAQNFDSRVAFYQRVERDVGKEDLKKVRAAAWLSKRIHEGQTRQSGERYFEHPKAVCLILMDFGPATTHELALSMLHDSVEDGYFPQYIIEQLFGSEFVEDLDRLSKVIPIFGDYGIIIDKQEKETAFYYGNIYLAPYGVRRVKLADRLHNLRTLGSLSPARQARIIQETITYILPIADDTDIRLAKAIRHELDLLTAKP